MVSRTLNFIDAMHLSSIVIKYFDIDELESKNKDALALDLIEKSSLKEVAEIINIFSGSNISTDDSEAMALVMGNLVAIDLHRLVLIYKKVGFSNDAQ